MMRGALFFLALLSVGAAREAVTPVEKVIELLKKLEVQVTEEGKKEAEAYDKYACFCKEQADNKQYAIEKSTKKIEKLDAEITDLDAKISALNTAIGELTTKISGLEKDIEDAEKIRDGEHKDYVPKAQDMADAIAACKAAIEALKDSKGDMEGHVDKEIDLVQVRKVAVLALASQAAKKGSLSEAQWRMLNDFAKKQPNSGEAAQYEYHSNDIIATLEGLLQTFTQNKEDLDQDEFEANSAFEKKRLGLQNQKKFAEKEKAEKEALMESKTEEKQAAEEDRSQEDSEKTSDSEFLKVLTGECQEKARLWDQRSSTRADELKALSEAMKALEDGVAPNYAANKKLVGLQKKSQVAKGHWVYVEDAPAKSPSFLQLRGNRKLNDGDRTKKVQSMLMEAATKLKSKTLSAVLLKVSAAGDHFVKVRSIIKDLLAKLEQQAADEATQKGFCDTEMAKAITSRDEEQSTIEDTTAQITKKDSQIKTLKDEIATLSQEVADLKKALNEETVLREEEKAENEKTVADAGAGKTAVEQAISVLEQFYGFAQVKTSKYVPPNSDREGNTVGDLAPEVFDSEYNGKQDSSKGIIGMLEVILSDFDRTIEQVTNDETKADGEFQDFKTKNENDTTQKEKDIATKEGDIATLEDEVVGLKDALKTAETALQAALDELEKLHSMCVQGEETYAERVAKRKKEIEALKEAHGILENWQG